MDFGASSSFAPLDFAGIISKSNHGDFSETKLTTQSDISSYNEVDAGSVVGSVSRGAGNGVGGFMGGVVADQYLSSGFIFGDNSNSPYEISNSVEDFQFGMVSAEV